ncbi:MAG: hypothetical protein V1740_04250 [Candidatus Woesearchaeota archaeon]
MIDKKQFSEIRKELEAFEDSREQVISSSRDIIKLSKQIISGLHRDDADKKLISEITSKVKKLPKTNFDTGMGNVAVQEYVEAICFYDFVVKGKIPSYKELNVDVQSYLLGLSDLSGELVRKGVNSVIKKDYKMTIKIKDFVTELYNEFLQFTLRNGDLRRKVDEMKWNLKKLEDVAYDLSIKGKI